MDEREGGNEGREGWMAKWMAKWMTGGTGQHGCTASHKCNAKSSSSHSLKSINR